MRVEVNEAPKKEKTYPWVGKKESTGTVILFTAPETGVVLDATKADRIGLYDRGWLEYGFTPVDSITIYND